jgi:hypothetical protein
MEDGRHYRRRRESADVRLRPHGEEEHRRTQPPSHQQHGCGMEQHPHRPDREQRQVARHMGELAAGADRRNQQV